MKKTLFVFIGAVSVVFFSACETQKSKDLDPMASYRAQVIAAKQVVQDRRDGTTTSDVEYHHRMMACLGEMDDIWQSMADICEEYDECAAGGGMTSHMGGDHMQGGHMGGGHMEDGHMVSYEEMQLMHDNEKHMMGEMGLLEEHCMGEEIDVQSCEDYLPHHLDRMDGYLNMHMDMCEE